MKKKNGFIAISILYSFFLCFIVLMLALLADYVQETLILNKLNEPLTYEDNKLASRILIDNVLQDDSSIKSLKYGSPSSYTDNGTGLFKSTDDDGDTYYFRGAVENNYVSFAGMTWRIVRINGDETIRIILDDFERATFYDSNGNELEIVAFNVFEQEDFALDTARLAPQYLGYTYNNFAECTTSDPCDGTKGTSSTIKTYLDNWYEINLSTYDSYIATSNYCNNTNIWKNQGTIRTYNYIYTLSYNAYNLKSNPSSASFKCSGDMSNPYGSPYGGYYKLKIGMLSVDELIFAGVTLTDFTEDNFLYYDGREFWTMSPYSYYYNYYYKEQQYGTTYVVTEDMDEKYKMVVAFWKMNTDINTGDGMTSVDDENYVRPVINLVSDVKISGGDGTEGNPYKIS